MGAIKWIGAGLGWAIGGPIGALIGLVIGSLAEGVSSASSSTTKAIPNSRRRTRTTQGDISVSLIVLTAAMMKADGKILKSELNYVKGFLISTFGQNKAQDLLALLRDVLKKDIDITAVCNQIRINTDFSTRVNILDFLFGVAYSDGICTYEEDQMLRRIAQLLRISDTYVYSIRSRHAGGQMGSSKNFKDPYAILGIDKTATDDEVKKAYRRLAMKYHPDRVDTMGEEIMKNAEQQFKEINEAYEEIKKERSMP